MTIAKLIGKILTRPLKILFRWPTNGFMSALREVPKKSFSYHIRRTAKRFKTRNSKRFPRCYHAIAQSFEIRAHFYPICEAGSRQCVRPHDGVKIRRPCLLCGCCIREGKQEERKLVESAWWCSRIIGISHRLFEKFSSYTPKNIT